MTSSKWLLGVVVFSSFPFLCVPGFAADPEPGPARLVADLAPGAVPLYLQVSGFQAVGSRSVFLRSDDEQRLSLWVTDGTPAGTSPLAVLSPPGSYAAPAGSTGNVAFYRVGYREMAIWRTDGTAAGTFPVTSGLSLPPERRVLQSLSNGRLFFTACSPALGCELWSTDGTVAGTALAGETVSGPESGEIRALAAADGRAFLITEIPGEPAALWLADARGLTRLAEAPEAVTLLAGGNRAWFAARRAEIWTSDGTSAGTRRVAAFPSPRDEYSLGVGVLAVLDGRAWFMADDGIHGAELWSAGPRPGSQQRLTNVKSPYNWVRDLVKVGDRLLFVAPGAKGGSRLWTSNGNLRSSAPLTRCPGGCPQVVGPLTPLAPGRFVFYGHNPEGGGIWVTDGTSEGTRLLRQARRLWLSQAVPADGRALIQVTDEYETGDLWVTDGTVAGTFLAAAGGPTWSHYYGWRGPLSAGGANGRILFPGFLDGESFEEVLWSSDGSPAGSHPLLESRSPRGSHPYRLTPFRDGLLAQTCSDGAVEMRFVQGTETTVLQSQESDSCAPYFSAPVVLGDVAVFLQSEGLWRTDGTPEGTKILFPSTSAAGPAALAPFGGEAAVAVAARAGDTFITEIWLTDGTAAGTRKQVELPAWMAANGMTAAGGRLWFFELVLLADNKIALRPWVSDATPAGSHPATARYGHIPEDGQVSFVEAGGRVYFLFAELPDKIEIWGSDGTPAGTGPAVTRESGAGEIQGLAGIGGRLWLTAPRLNDPAGPLLPWVSDGTDAGTEPLADVDLAGDPDFAPPDRPPFVELDGRVYFGADEIWSTDGTPAGTARLFEIAPGLLASWPRDLTVWNGKLWFRARDGAHGMELWSSDGTAEGTKLVQDISPGGDWSAPAELTGADGGLYFSAHDREHGRELWVLPEP